MMLNPLTITEGAQRVAEADPHGLTLTLVSVLVVFAALLILYGVYSLSGSVLGRNAERKEAKPSAVEDILDETAAAIAMALHEYSGAGIHDNESGIITIIHKKGGWDDKKSNFRQYPGK